MFLMKTILVLATVTVLAAAALCQPIEPVGVIPICDLLRRPSKFNGKTLQVRGVYFAGGHGLYIKGDGCDGALVTNGHQWPPLIWISVSREEAEKRGFNYDRFVTADGEVSAAVFGARQERGFGVPVAKVTATFTGLFETRDQFDDQIGKPDDGRGTQPGFGDQGYAPAQMFVRSVTDIVVEFK